MDLGPQVRAAAGLLAAATKRWFDSQATTRAAAIAFYALTSLAPVLVIIVAVAGFALGQEPVRVELLTRVDSVAGAEAAALVERLLSAVAPAGAGLIVSAVALVAMIIGATAVFAELQSSLNAVWQVSPSGGLRALARKRAISFLVVLALSLVVLVSLVVRTTLAAVGLWAQRYVGVPSFVLGATDLVVSFMAMVGVLTLVYRVLPDARTPLRFAAGGAVAGALLFLPGRWLISLYLGRASVASAYGAAGALVIVLLWMYYSTMIVLWGGALARSLEEGRARPGKAEHVSAKRPGRHPVHALVWLAAGCAGFAAGAQPVAAQDGRVRVEIEGVDGAARGNVLAVLGLARLGDDVVGAVRVAQLHDRAPAEIRRALEPFGYYESEVDGTLDFEGGRWMARYRIAPGPSITLRRVAVTVTGPGATDSAFAAGVAAFPLRPGDVLLHVPYEGGKAALVDIAGRRGYLDAVFDTSEIRIDRAEGVADIVVTYATGPRFRFGPVSFAQDVLEVDVLRGLIPFREGDPFDSDRLLELQSSVARTPWFTAVEVVPRRDLADSLHVPIEVALRPLPPQRYLVGFGYGSDTGPRGTFETEFRRVGRSGHRAEGHLRLSAIERAVATQYIMPWAYPNTEVLTLSVGFSSLDTRTSESRKAILGAALGLSRGQWRESWSLSWARESFTIGMDEGVSNLLLAGAAWSRSRADDRLYPTRGNRVRLQVRGAADALLSDVSLVQLEARAAWIASLPWRSRVLVRADAGASWSSEFRDVPATLRYFAGGDQSIRGFGYQTLGPVDDAGSVTGGEYLLVGSFELERRIFERWAVAGFVDAGNAFSRSGLTVETGAGTGVRWLSPVGMIRVDGAFALSRAGRPFRLHLRFGPDL